MLDLKAQMLKAGLVTEDGERSRSGAVALLDAMVENVLEKIEVLAHRSTACVQRVLSTAAAINRPRILSA